MLLMETVPVNHCFCIVSTVVFVIVVAATSAASGLSIIIFASTRMLATEIERTTSCAPGNCASRASRKAEALKEDTSLESTNAVVTVV